MRMEQNKDSRCWLALPTHPSPDRFLTKLQGFHFHYLLPCIKSPPNLLTGLNQPPFCFLCIDRAQLGVLLHMVSVGCLPGLGCARGLAHRSRAWWGQLEAWGSWASLIYVISGFSLFRWPHCIVTPAQQLGGLGLSKGQKQKPPGFLTGQAQNRYSVTSPHSIAQSKSQTIPDSSWERTSQGGNPGR